MTDSDDDDEAKLDQSVILISEIKYVKPLICVNGNCKKKTVFNDKDLIVRCLMCHGSYHPECVGIEKIIQWKDLMTSLKNREEWKYVCEFCRKDLRLLVRIRTLITETNIAVISNQEASENKTSKIVSKIDILESSQEKIERKIDRMNEKLSVIEKNINEKSIENDMGDIKLANSLYLSKISESNERTKSIEEKVDVIKSMNKKIHAENEELTEFKRKKKKPKSYSVVLQTTADKTIDDLKEKMVKNYDPREVNVSRTFKMGNKKLVAVCEDEDEQRKFANYARNKYSDICEVKMPARMNRRIKALNIEIWTKFEDLSIEQIEKNVKEANIFLDQCKILKYMKARKNGQQVDNIIHIVIEVDESTYENVINNGRIRYLYQEIKVVDGLTVGKCYHCLSLDHPYKDCPKKNEERTCYNCGDNHKRKDCTAKQPICVNCYRANKEIKSGKKIDIHHNVNDFECPCYKRKHNFLNSKIINN